ncbi:peptidase M16 [Clostridium sulfidigenes]|uniref:Peptidase M16 n=1 Tax=Clostridium sulfidigenes TaxID=318464 RepID=A0A084JB15_9CLOT|nr:pitrilysin family protein [Clostridium sulfidigenes]KEZ86149.1 peptidase M16 [Clostridium sulfidigenes]
MKKFLFDTMETYLENGLRLITIKKETQIASLNIGVMVGAVCEEKQERGISHFIEHMLFKGTVNRDNEKLNSDLENLGGEYNAYTDYMSTVFNTTTLNEELDVSLELISDLLQHPTFLEEHIEKERGVILAELRSGKDDVEDLSFQKINDMAFTHSPLKVDVIGKEEIVKSISREDLIRYYNNHYVSNNTVITVVSSYEHEYVIELVKKYFSQWKRKEVNKPILNFEKNKDKFKITHRDNMEQSTIIYLYTFNDLTKKEELALRILNHKFGESSNSILFRELREDRGLAYDIYTSLDLTNNLKTLYIYAAVAPEDVDATIETINNCIEKIKEEIIVFDGNTINLMKKVFKTAIASTLEDSTDLGNYVVHQAMEEDNLYQFNEDMENLNYIVAQDLYEVAKKVLNKPTIHVLLCDRE